MLATGKKSRELAEAIYLVPLFWLALLSEKDLDAAGENSCINTNRKAAIARLQVAVKFLAKLFPEIEAIEELAEDFLARLRKLKAETLGVEANDHFAMRPEIFPLSLRGAINTIETQNLMATLAIPACTYEDPSTGRQKKSKPKTIKKSRDIICYAVGYFLDGSEDEDMLREFLVGYVQC